MQYGRFVIPVRVYVGLNFVRPVDDISQANRLLFDWPEHRRGAAYFDALDACSAALSRLGSVENARTAFQAFAQHVGIFAKEFPASFQGSDSAAHLHLGHH